MTKATMSYVRPLCDRFSKYFLLNDSNYNSENRLVSVSNPTLKQLMVYLVASEPNYVEEDWVRLFLKNALTASNLYQFLLLTRSSLESFTLSIYFIELNEQLLIGYLQLICFYAARQVSSQLQRTPNLQLHYPIEDCFAIATEVSLKPIKLLKLFDFNSGFPVHAYARRAINNCIKNQVVREVKSKAVKLSNYSLLLSLSPKNLEKALQLYGIPQIQIIKYRLVWQAFKELVNNGVDSNSSERVNREFSLTTKQVKQIIDYYQQQQQRLSLNLEKIDAVVIKDILTICVTAIRNTQQKRFIPLENIENNLQSEHTTITDNDLVQQEKKSSLDLMKIMVKDNFWKIETKMRNCLLLWLGLDVNQQDFIKIFDCQKQYQIARLFQRHQRILFKKMISSYNNSKMSTNFKKDNIKIDKDSLDYLKKYLQIYSREFFSEIFALIVARLTREEKQLLIKTYGDRLPATPKVLHLKTNLKILLQKAIEKKLTIKLEQFPSAESRAIKFIDRWLEANLANLYLN